KLMEQFAEIPVSFVAALAVALGFTVFLTIDQSHWWQLKPDYAFGWLVPVFVLYVVRERWPTLHSMIRGGGSSPLPAWLHRATTIAISLTLGFGLLVFVLGAIYRGGAGPTQPGSMALAMGFSCVLLGMIYFNVPEGRITEEAAGSIWDA